MSWDNQYSKLRDYIQSGQSDKAYSLLRISPNYKGYPVDYRPSSQEPTLLSIAVNTFERGDEKLIRYLLEAGADVNIWNNVQEPILATIMSKFPLRPSQEISALQRDIASRTTDPQILSYALYYVCWKFAVTGEENCKEQAIELVDFGADDKAAIGRLNRELSTNRDLSGSSFSNCVRAEEIANLIENYVTQKRMQDRTLDSDIEEYGR